MPDLSRSHDVTGLTAAELERARHELRASLALIRPDSAARVPILAHLSAIDAELAQLGGHGQADGMRSVNLTPGQVDRIGQLSDQWSFFWDNLRSLWIAAEDCPEGERSRRSSQMS